MTRSIDVVLNAKTGDAVTVTGTWLPWIKATELEPAEGGALNDPRIMSGKYDVTNSFTAPGLAEWIIAEAERMLIEEDERGR